MEQIVVYGRIWRWSHKTEMVWIEGGTRNKQSFQVSTAALNSMVSLHRARNLQSDRPLIDHHATTSLRSAVHMQQRLLSGEA